MRAVRVLLVGVLMLWVPGVSGAAPRPDARQGTNKPPELIETPVLQAARDKSWRDGSGTVWRYFEVWQTEVARLDSGKLVRVDPLKPRVGFDAFTLSRDRDAGAKDLKYPMQEAAKITGSALPPANWTQPDFDDSGWVRTATPMGAGYRSIALACLRGKFTVNDPAQVPELTLDASVQGGAVFYLNGQEMGRVGLPAGKIDSETLAEDYPKETFVAPSGALLPQGLYGGGPPLSETEFSTVGRSKEHKDPVFQARYKQRFRHMNVKIPGTALRNGINVLAIEVHRAPAVETMFTTVIPKTMGYDLAEHRTWWWNRASLEDVKLTAKAKPGAVVGNIARPGAPQVWNWPVWERVDPRGYGDPTESLGPIRIRGARNGSFSGQVVVSSTNSIKALKVELRTSGSRAVPRSWLRVRYPAVYPGIGFDPIEDSVPAEIARVRDWPAVIQPIWVTADIPKDAQPGNYTATLTVGAEGLEAAAIPMELHVSGWTIPDPQDYVTHNAFIQSPDSAAITYQVPMWSKEHWRLIDRSFQVLGTLATKELNIPLVRRTHFGNEHGMVWWVKKPDGSYRPSLDIVEKYMDTAVKHLGRIPVVCFYVIEADVDGCPWVTEFDPATGNLKNAKAPAWGTEEARAFWRPAFEGLRKILAKHSMEKSMALGYHAGGGNGPCATKECIRDLNEVVPEARWVRVGHYWFEGQDKLERGPNGNPWARVALVSGRCIVGWDPDTDKPFYGWRNPYPVLAYTRGIFSEHNPLSDYRLDAETVLLSGWRAATTAWNGRYDIAGGFGRDGFPGVRGSGPWGADFWAPVIGRFNDPSAGIWDPRCSWSTVTLNAGLIPYVIGKGANGPVPSVRSELLREGLQEAEARVFCQNALLDENLKTKLGPDLARRSGEVCDNRTRALRYLGQFGAFRPSEWQDRSLELYDLAAEVHRALGQK